MSRSARLLDLLQLLRRHRSPIPGRDLAATLGISLRTLYRDIATLQAQGAAIDGEAGLGYILRPGFLLPPLMFSAEEIEALVLGSRWVAGRTDGALADAAHNALARIAAVLPAELRQELDASTLLIGPSAPPGAQPQGVPQDAPRLDLTPIRAAIRAERKLALSYRDAGARDTERVIWPFALGFFDHVRIIVAWCELRQDLRHFRADRILSVAPLPTRYPRRRQALLREWREREGIAPL